MRILVFSLFVAVSMLVTACGGGGGSSSSAKNVGATLSLDFENSRATEDGFYVSNTKINAVTLSYTNHIDSSGVIDITSAVQSGVVTLSELVADTTYYFNIVAISDENIQACTGSTAVLIAPDTVTQADLVCVFIDDYAVENAVYEIASALSSENLTEASVDSFIAKNFGTHNGMTREEFIADFLDDSGFGFTDASVKLTKVDVELIGGTTAVSAARIAGSSEAYLTFYFSDGSVMKERTWVVKENDKWVLAGNERKYEATADFAAYYYIPSSQYTTTTQLQFFSGIDVDFWDPSSLVTSVEVTGTGLAEPYIFEKDQYCTDCDSLYLVSPYQTDIPSSIGYDFMNLFGSSSTTVGANPVYTLSSTYADNSTDTMTYTVAGTPVPQQSLTENHFIMLSGLNSQNIYDYEGKTSTFTFIKPTAYETKLVEVEIHLSDASSNHREIEFLVPLTASSFTVDFSQFTDFTPVYGNMSVTAVDSEGKFFTTY